MNYRKLAFRAAAREKVLRGNVEAPARQIAENSEADSGVVVERMRNSDGNIDFDASKNEYVYLVKEGIIDPTKVVRTALENAVSVASIMLLTEATMTKVEERPKTDTPNQHWSHLMSKVEN